MITGFIKAKIVKAVKELIQEGYLQDFAESFFEEHLEGGKLSVTPDFKNQGIYIKFEKK